MLRQCQAVDSTSCGNFGTLVAAFGKLSVQLLNLPGVMSKGRCVYSSRINRYYGNIFYKKILNVWFKCLTKLRRLLQL